MPVTVRTGWSPASRLPTTALGSAPIPSGHSAALVSSEPASRLTLGREIAAVFGLFTLLGFVYTYPLVWYFSSGIPYVRVPASGAEIKWMQPGDNLQLYYWFWLMKDNLVGGSRLFTNPYEFDVTPVLPPQRYGFYQFPLSLLFVLLSPLGGAVAYNGMVILSFGLAAGAMYLLVRLYTERRGAALVAALIFALAPFRLGQLLGGHSNGFLFFLVPLTLYGYEMGLRRRGVTFGVLAGLCLVSLALTDFHLLYYLVLLSAGYWLVRGLEALDLPWAGPLPALLRAARSPRSSALALAAAGVTGAVSGLGLARRAAPAWQALLAVGVAAMAVGALWLFSALLRLARESETAASPAPAEALRRAGFTLAPLLLFAFYALHAVADVPRLGRLLLAVALAGVALLQLPDLLGLVWRRRARLLPLARVLLPVAAAILLSAGYVFSLRSAVMTGSFTATGGRPYALIARNAPLVSDLFQARNADDERAIYVGILPALLVLLGLAGWRREPRARGTLLLYGAGFLLALTLSLGPSLDPVLPLYGLLYTYLPYFNYPRSPARLMVVTFTALAVLAGYALRRLPAGRAWARTAVVCVAVGIGLEYAPFRAVGITLLDPGNPLYRAIASEPADGRFLAIPLFPGDSHQSSVYEYYVTTTRARMINGYNPLVSRDYVAEIFDRLVNLNLGEIRAREYELLKALRVRFLVVHEELFFWKVSPFPGSLTVKNLRASPYLAFRGKAGDRSLFEVRAAPDGAAPRFALGSPIGVLHELEEYGRRNGREVADPEASNGRALVVEEGRDGPGYVALGLAPLYPTGTYLAAFRLKLDGPRPTGTVAVIDVTAERGRQTLARRELTGADFREPGAYEDFDLEWALEAPGRVEFRVNYRGQGRLRADRIYVSFLDQRAPAPAYEAEELLRQSGEVRDDPDASGGRAVYVPAGSPEAYPAMGPYRRYPPGRYEAVFRVKLDAAVPATGEVAVLDVSADRGRRQLTAHAVTAGSLSPPGRYHEIRLPFTVDRPAVLEFRVLHRGRAGLWIDRVTVRPAEASP